MTSYEDLLNDNFEQIYFEKTGKHHAVGKADMMSVWRRKPKSHPEL
jgi:hypothetical protein